MQRRTARAALYPGRMDPGDRAAAEGRQAGAPSAAQCRACPTTSARPKVGPSGRAGAWATRSPRPGTASGKQACWPTAGARRAGPERAEGDCLGLSPRAQPRAHDRAPRAQLPVSPDPRSPRTTRGCPHSPPRMRDRPAPAASSPPIAVCGRVQVRARESRVARVPASIPFVQAFRYVRRPSLLLPCITRASRLADSAHSSP